MTRSTPTTGDVAATFAAVERLLRRVGKGDAGALADLYDATAPRVHGLVSRLLGPGQVAQEVTARIYEAVWRGEERPVPGASLPWLMDVAHRRSLAQQRGEKGAQVPRQRLASVPTGAPRAFPPEKAWMTELADDERRALSEVYLRGHTTSVADRRLGWAPGTVVATLHRAMIHLAEVHNREPDRVLA